MQAKAKSSRRSPSKKPTHQEDKADIAKDSSEHRPILLRDKIEDIIATGIYHAGDKVDVRSLADRFGVSRTPVREVLAFLEAAGLVQTIPNRGYFIREFSFQRLIEMFEVMAELEASMGRMAARRMTENDQKLIVAAHDRCSAAALQNNSDDYFYGNEEFHFAIYGASHNSYLVEQATTLFRQLKPYRRLQLRVRGRVSASIKEHERVIAGIFSGNEEAAARALRNHVMVQGERFGDLISQLPVEDEGRLNEIRSHANGAASRGRL